MAKPRVATTSLCGCFGCHMSLARHRRPHPEAGGAGRFRPLADQRHQGDHRPVDVGLIEGGCCNEENVKVLQEFRRHCKVLISVGDCAINGGMPAMRNMVPLDGVLPGGLPRRPDGGTTRAAAYLTTRRSRCCSIRSTRATRWSRSTFHLPGCPPPADTLWAALTALLTVTSRSSCRTS